MTTATTVSTLTDGRICRSLRQKRGISQCQLAKDIGVSFQQLAHFEQNQRRLPPQALTRLTEILQPTDTEIEALCTFLRA